MAAEPSNPYPGPRPFEPGDAAFFFGRDREAERLVSLVISERVVLFHGPSGAGKTSLLSAKVLPQLEAEGFVVFPLARVGRKVPALGPAANVFSASVLADLGFESEADAPLALSRRLAPLGDGLPRVLVLDQFEEILSAHAEHWRSRELFFLELVRALLADPALSLLLAAREDQVAGLERYAPLLPGELGCRLGLEPLSVEAAKLAVARPAAAQGRPFEPGVAEALVERLSLEQGSGGLRPGPSVEPIQLQVVCRQLWTKVSAQPGATITTADVEGFGPVGGALERFYEETVERVVTSRAATERLLRDWFEEELLTAGPRKLRQPVHEEAAGLPPAALAHLVDNHLLRREQRRGGVWLELVHDTFIEPIEAANRRWRERQHQLLRDARAWEEAGEPDDGFLYQAEELRQAQAWAAGHATVLSELERRFLARSQRRQEAQAERERHARRLRRFNLGLIALALVTATLLVIAYSQWQKAERSDGDQLVLVRTLQAREKLPQSRSAALEKAYEAVTRSSSQVSEAEGVFLEAYYTPHAEEIPLLPALSSPDGEVVQVALDRRGQHLAMAVRGDTATRVTVWSLDGEDSQLLLDRDGRGEGLALSRDGPLVASAGAVEDVELWGLEIGAEARRLESLGEAIVDLTFSPRGGWLAGLGEEGTVFAWQLPQGRLVLRRPAASAAAISLALTDSGDSPRLALGDRGGRVTVIELLGGAPEREFATHVDQVQSLAWSPEGRRLASADSNGEASVWDAQSHQWLAPIGAEEASLSLSWSDDGRFLFSLLPSGKVQVRSAGTNVGRKVVMALPSVSSSLRVGAFSSAGSQLVTVANRQARDGRPPLQLWRLEADPAAAPFPAPHTVRFLASTSDERWFASVSEGQQEPESSVHLWEVGSGKEAVPPLAHDAPVIAVAAGPEAGALLTAAGGEVLIWNVVTRQSRVLLGREKLQGTVSALASFSGAKAGSALVATGDDRGEVRLWGPGFDRPKLSISTDFRPVRALSFSPDGKLLAVLGEQGFRVFGSRDGEPATPELATDDTNRGAGGETLWAISFFGKQRLLVGGTLGVEVWELKRSRELSWARLRELMRGATTKREAKRLFALPGESGDAYALALAGKRVLISRKSNHLQWLDLDVEGCLLPQVMPEPSERGVGQGGSP